jgi:hypothetical protein
MSVETTDRPEKLLNDFIERMSKVQAVAKLGTGVEALAAYSVQVQIEAEITRLSLELSKLKVLESMASELYHIRLRLAARRL